MSASDWLHIWCPACEAGRHLDCDPLRRDRPGLLCECAVCLPHDWEDVDLDQD